MTLDRDVENCSLWNFATLKIAASGTSRRWKPHILERRDVGPNIETLPCFYEHER